MKGYTSQGYVSFSKSMAVCRCGRATKWYMHSVDIRSVLGRFWCPKNHTFPHKLQPMRGMNTNTNMQDLHNMVVLLQSAGTHSSHPETS
jgi:hypothetical protein